MCVLAGMTHERRSWCEYGISSWKLNIFSLLLPPRELPILTNNYPARWIVWEQKFDENFPHPECHSLLLLKLMVEWAVDRRRHMTSASDWVTQHTIAKWLILQLFCVPLFECLIISSVSRFTFNRRPNWMSAGAAKREFKSVKPCNCRFNWPRRIMNPDQINKRKAPSQLTSHSLFISMSVMFCTLTFFSLLIVYRMRCDWLLCARALFNLVSNRNPARLGLIHHTFNDFFHNDFSETTCRL